MSLKIEVVLSLMKDFFPEIQNSETRQKKKIQLFKYLQFPVAWKHANTYDKHEDIQNKEE